MNKKLRLSRRNKMIAGVCGGIGEYLNIDPVLVRIGIALLCFVSFFSPVIIYVILWAIMPLENE